MGGEVQVFKKRASLLKALVAVALATLLAVSMVPAQALAAGTAAEEWAGGFEYDIKGSEGQYGAGVYIYALDGFGIDDTSPKSVTIPKQIEGVDVVQVRFPGSYISLLDVSKSTALKHLDCGGNQLTSLDVSKNTALEYLWCGGNQLTSLDVSKNKALSWLSCYDNQLTSLDVSKNTALEYLDYGGNQLTSLDTSKNKALTSLYCDDSQLTSLDVSKNTKLQTLSCVNNKLASLDVSKNTALKDLWCLGNQLTSLDVSKNTALEYLYCYDNQLTSLDVSKNTKLQTLSCANNKLTSLDISKSKALGWLYCNDNFIVNTSKLDAWLKKHPDSGQIQPQKPIKVTSTKTQSALTLVKGKTATLPATVITQPAIATNKKVTFRSSNSKVATVNKTTGKIKALKAGKTTITVTSTDGKKTAKCVVTVVAKTTKIKTLKAFKSVGLLVGKTIQVKPKITPAKATGIIYKYNSSKKSVATIDKAGVITALKKGTTTITVKAGNKTQKFKVTVGTVLPKKITLNKKSVSIKAKATTKLTVKWSPTNADPKTVTWTSSNKRVATVDKNGKVKAIKKGKCTITATTWNGKTVKCSVTVR